ncbi:recombinase family protein [Burkholderia pyrrocinia]|nr:recombinase family protein [Burkholderia pyrrocinia]EKS9892786.1 recombinase family protein [Burkholderia pyrrocinia]EKS9907661.1 recombinase family protein [Burkholderia pyrrocinia]
MAYSYIRFSTAQQALGDSLRRQVESTEQYCEEHGLTLARASAYRDLGVSAFRKKNIEAGKLAEFIRAVKSGKVSPGSYLIVEQFDRLSRAEVNVALRLFLDLVDAGIVVVTLADKKVWNKDSVADVGDLITAIIYMSRANDESERKSDRLSAVWEQKKKRAADGTATRIVTSEAPRWLRAKADKTGFDVVPELAHSVRRVFEMRIDGAGVVAICRRANQERWPLPGKMPVKKLGESDEDFGERRQTSGQWHQSLVARILKNRAVLGEYQPRRIDTEHQGARVPVGEPIRGYYPSIVDEATFGRAQATALRRGVRPGRRDPHARNWLYGLVKCGACGNSLVRKNKTSAKQPGYSRYYCVARVRGATKCPSVSSAQLEALVNYVAASGIPLNWAADTSLDALKAQADILELEIASSKASIDGIADLAGSTASESAKKSLLARLDREGAALDAKEAQLAHVRAELSDQVFLGGEDAAHERLQRISREIDAIASGQMGLDGALRLREELARIFQKIVVHQAEQFIEFFIKGRDKPAWLPFDFLSLEAPIEPTAEQLEAAERDIDALRRAMED